MQKYLFYNIVALIRYIFLKKSLAEKLIRRE